MKLATLCVTATALVLSACASQPTTSLAIQNINNEYEVMGLGKSQVIAKNNAITAANKTCGSKAAPILVNEKSSYNGAFKGVVNEKTGQVIQAAADMIGGLAGKSAGLSRDDDYQTVLTFKCVTQ
ncbi:hypothetical protein [uncultured Acinetobacter sp.]|uniref:hypothetical protein n=1 Tax=uncultured Acinetobacter sp. TaxID=165433 RepID=UPI0026240C11|nr:hypothetical protein [uncultured Acinetobacter sp.]